MGLYIYTIAVYPLETWDGGKPCKHSKFVNVTSRLVSPGLANASGGEPLLISTMFPSQM